VSRAALNCLQAGPLNLDEKAPGCGLETVVGQPLVDLVRTDQHQGADHAMVTKSCVSVAPRSLLVMAASSSSGTEAMPTAPFQNSGQCYSPLCEASNNSSPLTGRVRVGVRR